MMKSYATICLNLWMVCAYMLAGESARIEKVQTFSNESKSSVIIYYSGAERLRFFAIDSAEDLLTLDFPGVYSEFDFSALQFDQVREVRQAVLDPEVSKGLSVRFFLRPGASYQIFDQGRGELTILFEGMQTSADSVSAVPPLPLSAPEESPAPTGALVDAGGRGGDGFLSHLTVIANDHEGRVLLKAKGIEKFKSFSLREPQRFVVDLYDTVFSLEQSDFSLDLDSVKGIRVRQFQTSPTPITRVVIDLAEEPTFNVGPFGEGLLIAFAENTERLTALMTRIQNGEAGAPMIVMEKPVDPRPDVVTAALAHSDAWKAEEDLTSEVPPGQKIAEPNSNEQLPEIGEQPVEMSLKSTGAEKTSEVATFSPSPTAKDPGADRLLPESAEQEIVADAVPSENMLIQPETVRPSSAEGLSGEMLVGGAESQIDQAGVANEEPKTINEEAPLTPGNNLIPLSEDSVSVGSSDKNIDPVAEGKNIHELVSEPEVALESPSVVSSDEKPDLPVDQTQIDAELDAFTQNEDAVAATEVFQEAKPVIDIVAPDDETLDEDFDQQDTKPTFVMASDLDQQMNSFLEDPPGEETLYTMMKGVKSNRKIPDQVIVTNETIESVRLGEMRAMQEDTGDEDFSNLFNDSAVDGAGTTERLDVEEKKYKGFEISIIDVKDADVVDLLRFIAHQVGINLYVDSSVKDLRATYRFRNIPWDQALDIILANANLDKQFLNGVLRVATTEKFQKEEEARRKLDLERELSVPTETVTFSLNYANAKDAKDLVQEYLSIRGNILMDERTNMLIIEDIPRRMTTIRALIKKIDRVVAQVSIEARLVETTKRFLRELGIQWGLSAQYSPEIGTDTGLDFPNRASFGGPVIGGQSAGGILGGYAVNMPVVAENPSGVGLTLGNFLDNFKLDISLQMLETEGFGQIISSPKVTTQNNATAIIKNGQKIPIQTVNRGTITVSYVEAVLLLEVTPHITADETVIMDLIVDKSEVDFTRTVFGNPVINIRKAETTVLVKNGGTAVIGGIFTLNEQGLEDGIPGLRKVPLLKRIFSHELTSFENQELLIFVTPRIVKY